MGLIKGGFSRLMQTALYALIFCCAAIILGIFSYFLSILADRDLLIPQQWKAVEGIAGIAVVYLIFAVVLTCCLGGVSFFAFAAIVLDVLLAGGMIAIAVLTRQGAKSCKGFVKTPIGNGQADEGTGFGKGGAGVHKGENATYAVKYGNACRMNKAVFAVAIIAAILFLCTAAFQIVLVRSHKKEKRYGPGPDNNYTSGKSGAGGFLARRKAKKNAKKEQKLHEKDLESSHSTGTAVGAGAVGAGAGGLMAPHHNDVRPSHETGYTGSTVAAPNNNAYDKVDNNYGVAHGAHGTPQAQAMHDNGAHAPHGAHGGYYTQPQGTGVNPYGYDNTTTTATMH